MCALFVHHVQRAAEVLLRRLGEEAKAGGLRSQLPLGVLVISCLRSRISMVCVLADASVPACCRQSDACVQIWQKLQGLIMQIPDSGQLVSSTPHLANLLSRHET